MTNGTHFSFFLPQGEAFRTVLGHEKTEHMLIHKYITFNNPVTYIKLTLC